MVGPGLLRGAWFPEALLQNPAPPGRNPYTKLKDRVELESKEMGFAFGNIPGPGREGRAGGPIPCPWALPRPSQVSRPLGIASSRCSPSSSLRPRVCEPPTHRAFARTGAENLSLTRRAPQPAESSTPTGERPFSPPVWCHVFGVRAFGWRFCCLNDPKPSCA